MAPGGGRRFGQQFQQSARGITAPMEIPRVFHQLVTFLLDGSDSMTDTGQTGSPKGEELHKAIQSVLARLQASKNRNCFDISCWVYSSEYKQVLQPTSVCNEALAIMSFDPTTHIAPKGTLLSGALEEAVAEARAYLERHANKQAKVLLVLLSDGGLHDTRASLKIVESLRDSSDIILSTIFFETQIDGIVTEWVDEATGESVEGEPETGESINSRLAETMRLMSSDEREHFATTVDPDMIRNQMIKSISKVSQV